MTSRCQGLFPPHPVFEGKALGTRLGNNGKGEERKEAFSRLSPLPIVPRALSIFSVIAIFIGIPSRNLCGGES